MAFFEHPIQKGWRGEMGGASGREHPSLVARTMRMLGERLEIPNDLKVYETTAFIRKNNRIANTCFGLWNDLLNTLTSRDQVTLCRSQFIMLSLGLEFSPVVRLLVPETIESCQT